MSTVTQTMLEERIGAAELILLTDDSATGAVNAAIMQQAIDEGEAEIDARLGQRYGLPLALTHATTRAAVTHYYLVCAVHRLYMRRNREVTLDLAAEYKSAIAWADKIAEGKQVLLGETEPGEDEEAAGGFVVDADTRVVSRENMAGL